MEINNCPYSIEKLEIIFKSHINSKKLLIRRFSRSLLLIIIIFLHFLYPVPDIGKSEVEDYHQNHEKDNAIDFHVSVVHYSLQFFSMFPEFF